MTDIVFLDTETIGLHPEAPIWEFAGIRRFDDITKAETDGWPLKYTARGPEVSVLFTIQHDPGEYLDDLPDWLLDDYGARYDETTAWCERVAASQICALTKDATVIGCNPGFDLERLTKLLQRNKIEPSWHYHPLDIASIAAGYLAARNALPPQPWKSDALACALGVYAEEYERHTAMGDVLWTRAQWDAIGFRWLT
jgi:hypothetical protein